MFVVLGMTLLSGAMAAKAQSDQGAYNEKVAKYNAAVDLNLAEDVKKKGIAVETEEKLKAAQLIGRQKAAAASRGAVVDVGSSLRAQEDTQLISDINVMRIRENVERQVGVLERKAELGIAAGEQAESQAKIGAISTLIGSAGKAYGQFAGGGAPVDQRWYDFDTADDFELSFSPSDFQLGKQ